MSGRVWKRTPKRRRDVLKAMGRILSTTANQKANRMRGAQAPKRRAHSQALGNAMRVIAADWRNQGKPGKWKDFVARSMRGQKLR